MGSKMGSRIPARQTCGRAVGGQMGLDRGGSRDEGPGMGVSGMVGMGDRGWPVGGMDVWCQRTPDSEPVGLPSPWASHDSAAARRPGTWLLHCTMAGAAIVTPIWVCGWVAPPYQLEPELQRRYQDSAASTRTHIGSGPNQGYGVIARCSCAGFGAGRRAGFVFVLVF